MGNISVIKGFNIKRNKLGSLNYEDCCSSGGVFYYMGYSRYIPFNKNITEKNRLKG